MHDRIRRTYDLFARGLDYHRQFLDRFLPEGLIAEVGCGEARVGWFYQSPTRRFIGFDIDEPLITAAMALGAPPLHKADAFSLPLEDSSIDGFVGLGIFELGGDSGDRGAMEAARVLKPGGLLYITVPFQNWARRRGGIAEWRGMALPAFSEESLRELLDRHGFETILTRPSSLAHGIGPFRRLARFFPGLLVRERGLSYDLIGPLLKPHANSLLAIATKR